MNKFPAFKNPGFTLVELLVSVSILAVLTAVTIPNFNNFIRSQNLKQSQEQIKNGIRDTQIRAMAGVDSTNYSYWVFRASSGGTTFNIGKSADTTSCGSITVVDTSAVLPGDATLGVSSSPACIYYAMGSGIVTQTGLYSNIYVRTSDRKSVV